LGDAQARNKGECAQMGTAKRPVNILLKGEEEEEKKR